jgi:hypothetical protein
MAKKATNRATAKKASAKRAGATRTRATKTRAKKTSSRRKAARRELIDTGSDKRFVRRGSAGRFKESDSVRRSLPADRRQKARTKVKSGQGDKGDR